MLYFAGKRVDNAAVGDRLGTAVVKNGQQRMGFFPYGLQRSGTSSQVQYATYTRDATTNLDNAQQRYYPSQVSRFTTPDPKPSSAEAGNPQSWNRYSYALGDPIKKTDPSGADPEFEDGEETSPFGGMASSGGLFGDGEPGTVDNPFTFSITTTSTAVAGNTTTSTNPNPMPPVPSWVVWVMAQGLSKPFVYGVATAPQSQSAVSKPSPAPMQVANNAKNQCLEEYYNSTLGRAIDFGSLLGMVPGWSPDATENLQALAVLGGVKYGGLTAEAAALNRLDVLTIRTLNTTTTIGSSAGAGLSVGLKLLGKAGTAAMGFATGLDVLVHSACDTVACQEAGTVTPITYVAP
jgi:RHS repeat-associated protein